jgi:hypothetical protein
MCRPVCDQDETMKRPTGIAKQSRESTLILVVRAILACMIVLVSCTILTKSFQSEVPVPQHDVASKNQNATELSSVVHVEPSPSTVSASSTSVRTKQRHANKRVSAVRRDAASEMAQNTVKPQSSTTSARTKRYAANKRIAALRRDAVASARTENKVKKIARVRVQPQSTIIMSASSPSSSSESENVIELSRRHVEPYSNVSAAICFKTLFGDIDLGIVLQWVGTCHCVEVCVGSHLSIVVVRISYMLLSHHYAQPITAF